MFAHDADAIIITNCS